MRVGVAAVLGDGHLAVVDVDVPRAGAVDVEPVARVHPGGLGRVDRGSSASKNSLGSPVGGEVTATGSGARRPCGRVAGSSAASASADERRRGRCVHRRLQVDRVGERAEPDRGDPAEADREPDREARTPSRSAAAGTPGHHHRDAEGRDHADADERERDRAGDAADEHVDEDQRRGRGAGSRSAPAGARAGRPAAPRPACRARRRAASARAGASRAPSSGRARPPRAARR